jgi:hypothetical protein
LFRFFNLIFLQSLNQERIRQNRMACCFKSAYSFIPTHGLILLNQRNVHINHKAKKLQECTLRESCQRYFWHSPKTANIYHCLQMHFLFLQWGNVFVSLIKSAPSQPITAYASSTLPGASAPVHGGTYMPARPGELKHACWHNYRSKKTS